MKTAISIPNEIFKKAEKFAKKHRLSRSDVFVIAIKDLLEKDRSKQLLDLLNEVYSDIETKEDIRVRKKALEHYAKHMLKERY